MAIFKKLSRKLFSSGPNTLKYCFQGLIISLLAIAVLSGFWYISLLGPKKVDYENLGSLAEIPEEIKLLQQESIKLEVEFEEIIALREPRPVDMLILKKSLEKQSEYVDGAVVVDSETYERLNNLDERYQNLAAKPLIEESLKLEQEAEEHWTNQEYEHARGKYLAAQELQSRINELYPKSNAYNLRRLTELKRQIGSMMAEPLLEKSILAEKNADEFIKRAQWKQAEETLKEALNIQAQLNADHRNSSQANSMRFQQLRLKLITTESAQIYTDIKEIARLGDERLAANEYLEAVSLYQEAGRLQKKLNEAFPDSPYGSSNALADFQRKSQTAESFELGLQIEGNHELLQSLLAERSNYEVAEVMARLRRDIKQMQDAFPLSSLNDQDLQLKIRYLYFIQNDLGFIQDRVYDALLPIPQVEGWSMLRTEVSQALYALIMDSNPSRNQGDLRPIDSVSWIEAKDFCLRLSWIMGKSVRLPSENEFRQALGRLRYVLLEDHAWGASNSGGLPVEVGKKKPFASGFYDLLGNTSEWLESTDRFETEDARHIGGHAQDRFDAIYTVPVRDTPRGGRNRLTGFRFVVNVE